MFRGKKIVVVMLAYNAARTLRQTYDEVMAQEVIDTVVIVDDASQDETTASPRSCRTLASKRIPESRLRGKPEDVLQPGPRARRRHRHHGASRLPVHTQADPGHGVDAREWALSVRAGKPDCRKLRPRGGMPIWKYVANRFLTFVENVLLGAKLSNYHTGYRAFVRKVLERVPMHENSDAFVFDNQMLV